MSETVIKVENIAKQYRLGQVGRKTLNQDINRWWHAVRGKEDPYLKIGQENDRTKKGTSEYVWALQDINFDVQRGDVLGIIGRNGAGKSTLLKILSKVTAPTKGTIKIKGGIASLLEVGTGFHPDLSGRDNIYLNGAILGMTKKEITSKFDEIVDFAGVERYIDTPVKRYSSGMYVRLAFAVAAHLEPEILIVDEVLAVGDAEFQKKCLGKMKDVSTKDGRTILFVSHNLQAISQICTRGLLLKNGLVEMAADVSTCVAKYLEGSHSNEAHFTEDKAPGDKQSFITDITLFADGEKTGVAGIEQEITLEIVYVNKKEDRVLNLSVAVFDAKGTYAFSTPSSDKKYSVRPHKPGTYKGAVTIPANLFNAGNYYFTVLLVENGRTAIVELDSAVMIETHTNNIDTLNYFGYWGGVLRPKTNWVVDKIK